MRKKIISLLLILGFLFACNCKSPDNRDYQELNKMLGSWYSGDTVESIEKYGTAHSATGAILLAPVTGFALWNENRKYYFATEFAAAGPGFFPDVSLEKISNTFIILYISPSTEKTYQIFEFSIENGKVIPRKYLGRDFLVRSGFQIFKQDPIPGTWAEYQKWAREGRAGTDPALIR